MSGQGITSLWACKACGADNKPRHCQDEWCERTRVCRCDCSECNPETCRECGTNLEEARREAQDKEREGQMLAEQMREHREQTRP